jgi:hypothetical protein
MMSTEQGFLTTMMRKTIRRYDNMITFPNQRGFHGFSSFNSSGFRGHLRPIDNDIGVVDELRSGLLHDVGRGLDKSRNFEYIRNVRLSSGHQQGEK